MTDFSAPDQTQRVTFDGHQVVTYRWGEGDEVVFLPSGGPRLPCRHLVEPHLRLVNACYRVVSHDELATGAAARAKDDCVGSSTMPPICNSPRATAS